MHERPSVTGPDRSVDADRLRGTTPPESGPEGANVVGRPEHHSDAAGAFHVAEETPAREDRSLSEDAALAEGGSFDGTSPLQDLDRPRET